MNRCIVCKCPYEEGQVACPVCGFPLLFDRESDPATLQKLVDDTKNSYLADVSVMMLTYRCDTENGLFEEKSKEYTKLFDALQLSYGETLWFDKDYESVECDEPINVDIRVCHADVSVDYTLSVIPERMVNLGKIGIRLEDGFKARIVVGSDTANACSEEFSLIS